tara:strand:+ start:5220 stop:5618 length:399 start_codon:yes stop_codon:yes gene_type:complete
MTRINLIPPQELTRQHLVAEYRELPRTFALIKNWQKRPTTLPEQFTMGTGHVRFFYNKASFLVNRQRKLIEEMLSRGYSPQHKEYMELFAGIDMGLQIIWAPVPADIAVSRARIEHRLAEQGARELALRGIN